MSIVLRHATRWLVAILAGVLVSVAVAATPAAWDTALLAGWDAGIIMYLGLTFWMMSRADAQRTQEQSQALEPAALLTLVVVVITSAVGLLGAVALSARTSGRGQVAQTFHFAAGAVAVLVSWLLVHTEFALYYARTYYDEAIPDTQRPPRSVSAVVPFRKGLEFPNAEVVDYWDFMYYSFTIGMCYQTSDVTVALPGMRRVTLLHAVLSFLFVLVVLGFAVNAMGTAV
jgi:uncharacterized membrane protein